MLIRSGVLNDRTLTLVHFPYFEKKMKVGLRDLHFVCMSLSSLPY
jgi:hypothetical protein